MGRFELISDFKPTGDQPDAIKKLSESILNGNKEQTLLGVTGSGKTFTMANIIQQVQKPTIVLAHNKTLVGQLYSEFKELFPKNAVEYFVSYYDYYQPEAYIPGKDIYIEKDSSVNADIDKLRHSATSSLFERNDVIIISSVSCIYSLGDPSEYSSMVLGIRVGQNMSRDNLIARLVGIQYQRNDIDFTRNRFRVRGDVVEIFPSSADEVAIRVEFFGDEIDRISEIRTLTGEVIRYVSYVAVFPASHYVVSRDKLDRAVAEILSEMEETAKKFRDTGKFIEAQRIEERTRYDVEMLVEVGYCSGVENYSRILSGRTAGSRPYTLLDYFPSDFLMFIDESHVTLPQVRGMSGGDKARKTNLVEYGFRLPSAYDNRPLFFDEFEKMINQVVYVSATPGEYEISRSSTVAEQLIRPTGLVDPKVEVRKTEGQIDDLLSEIKKCCDKNQKVLVTTLTKNMAQDLTTYLENVGVKSKYIHHEVETMERLEIVRDLRLGKFDVLVGINLLREGLDIPEVSLVAILDADKEGFLRSATSLVQTIGRASRNAEGTVIMYADKITDSMKYAIEETERRRKVQTRYNEEHGITPTTITKSVRELIDIAVSTKNDKKKFKSKAEKETLIEQLTREMINAAKLLEFEHAAQIRDRIQKLKEEQ